jgi:alpha-tubulin suppressor-like RCC1 family protein
VYRIPRVLGTLIRFRSIECGHNHCLAISLYREVYCWGDNEYGKSGVGISSRHVRNPTLVASEGAIQIGCGHDHSMYLNYSHIYAWGCGEGGLLGNNNTVDTHIPGKVHLMDV